MKINPLLFPYIKQTRSISSKPFCSITKPQLDSICFDSKRKGKKNPDVLIKNIDSFINNHQDSKAAMALSDFYRENNGFEGIASDEKKKFQPIKDDIKINGYQYRYTNDNQEILVKEGAIAYRKNNKLYEAQIPSEGYTRTLKRSKENLFLVQDFCSKAKNFLAEGEIEECVNLMEKFYTSQNRNQKILKTLPKNHNFIVTKDAVLFVKKQGYSIIADSTRLNIEFNKSARTSFYHALNAKADVFNCQNIMMYDYRNNN